MSLRQRKEIKERLNIVAAPYNKVIPFYNTCTVSEHTLIANDVIEPLSDSRVAVDSLKPVPSYGAIYRLIGDGTHAPVFSSEFKKSSASGDYDSTLGVLNLVTFLFDGVDFWYSIIQPQ